MKNTPLQEIKKLSKSVTINGVVNYETITRMKHIIVDEKLGIKGFDLFFKAMLESDVKSLTDEVPAFFLYLNLLLENNTEWPDDYLKDKGDRLYPSWYTDLQYEDLIKCVTSVKNVRQLDIFLGNLFKVLLNKPEAQNIITNICTINSVLNQKIKGTRKEIIDSTFKFIVKLLPIPYYKQFLSVLLMGIEKLNKDDRQLLESNKNIEVFMGVLFSIYSGKGNQTRVFHISNMLNNFLQTYNIDVEDSIIRIRESLDERAYVLFIRLLYYTGEYNSILGKMFLEIVNPSYYWFAPYSELRDIDFPEIYEIRKHCSMSDIQLLKKIKPGVYNIFNVLEFINIQCYNQALKSALGTKGRTFHDAIKNIANKPQENKTDILSHISDEMLEWYSSYISIGSGHLNLLLNLIHFKHIPSEKIISGILSKTFTNTFDIQQTFIYFLNNAIYLSDFNEHENILSELVLKTIQHFYTKIEGNAASLELVKTNVVEALSVSKGPKEYYIKNTNKLIQSCLESECDDLQDFASYLIRVLI